MPKKFRQTEGRGKGCTEAIRALPGEILSRREQQGLQPHSAASKIVGAVGVRGGKRVSKGTVHVDSGGQQC